MKQQEEEKHSNNEADRYDSEQLTLIVLEGFRAVANETLALETSDGKLDEIERSLKKVLNKLADLETSVAAKVDALENKLIAKIADLEEKLINNQPGQAKVYSSCREEPDKVSGRYVLQIGSNKNVSVVCEQTAFGGGWIVIQHRFNGQVDFYRNWTEYRNGFGDLDGEFWLGLEYLHKLTWARKHELMVEVKDYEGRYGYARYDEFLIRSEEEKYRLKVGHYTGTAGDALLPHQENKFSTMDEENDYHDDEHCAIQMHGGWWYNSCGTSNLNGPYGNTTDKWKTMKWFYLRYNGLPMAYTRMMLREVN
ncbi:ficolin-2-like [Anopheles ziemanni]|uniref:ficolin-2-like n=1 Tax=Anopheles coustani TaxID=139045 RepID=UPI00265AEC41|nr:ficolin-2-like [Anopheles coustani]XP_058177064.1 ficolin-2-like [Anopheles ziemanni]